MIRALKQFDVNVLSARQLGIIFLAFSDKVTEAICLDELLRAELVWAVSALDCYVHDVVRIGMTQAFDAGSGEPNAYLNFGVSLGFVKRLLTSVSEPDRLALFDQEIRRVHGFKTFQNADSISQALSLIGLKSIWDKVGNTLCMSSTDVRTRLDVIVDRRNRIAHEGDIDPTMGIGEKYPIDFPTVQQAVDFLDSLVHAIQSVAIAEVAF
jgi:hypothetical protein